MGYAVSTTLANCLMGLESVHAVRNLQVNPSVLAMVRSEMNGFLRKLVSVGDLRDGDHAASALVAI